METAGNSDYTDSSDIEKKGLGTPATRASVIETLVKREYIKRDNKSILPTEKGINLINAVPEEIKSPKMTAEWESILQNIEKGNASDTEFMQGIIGLINELIQKYSSIDENSGLNFSRSPIGTCPKCGKKVFEYSKSYSCESGKDGCGFVIWKAVAGKSVSLAQAEKILSKGKSDLIKGFKSKAGKEFNAHLKLNNSTYAIEFEFENYKKK